MSVGMDKAVDPRAVLLVAVQQAGSTVAWATANNLSATYVADVLRGRREPGMSMLAALKLKRVLTYQEVKNDS